jgi:hypothetical protein
MTGSRIQDEATEKASSGMERFFSPMNLNRYRKLAAGAIDASERFRLLKMLDEELKAFRREARAVKSNREGA